MEEKKKTLRKILPLLLALSLMIAIGWLFAWLIGGEKDPASPTAQAFYFSLQREALKETFTPLSADEEALLRRELPLDPGEEARFGEEFGIFANQYHQASVAHRLYLERVNAPGTEIADRDRFLKLYLTENKKHRYLIERYSPIFSEILSPERMPRVFLLHERIRRERGGEKR
jgi:hypothetical protein